MTEEHVIEKPLIEQIVDEMLNIIEKQEEFDPQTITNLKSLALDGKLTKKTQVIETIKLESRENHESD